MSVLKKLVFVTIAALTAVVLVDVILTAIVSSPNDYLTATPNSGFVWEMNDELIPGIDSTSKVRFNNIGARSSELKIGDTRIKIAAFGGSTTACLALDQEYVWTNLLQNKLGSNFWVGNFGRPGNNSGHHTLQTQFILEKTELKDTKYVIILVGVNDLCGYLADSTKYLQDYSDLNYKLAAFEHIPNEGLPWYRTRFLFKTIKNFKRRITFLSSAKTYPEAIQETRDKRIKADKPDRLPELKPGILKYRERLSKIIQNCKTHGTQPIFFCQPVMWSDSLNYDLEKLLWFGHYNDLALQKTKYYDTPSLAKGMKIFNEALLDVCNKEAVPCFWLTLPQNTEAFYDDCHFNESGSRLVASQMYTSLKTVIPELTETK